MLAKYLIIALYENYSCLVSGSSPLPDTVAELVSYEEKDGALYKTIFTIVSL